MRYSRVRLLVALAMGLGLGFSTSAMAQESASKLGSKESLYRGNRLKPDPTPGGPALNARGAG